jgi:hypothetical protein
MPPIGVGPDRTNVSEGAMRRWRVSTGEGRDRLTPIDREEMCGGVRLETGSEAQPRFIGEHCNLLSRQQA